MRVTGAYDGCSDSAQHCSPKSVHLCANNASTGPSNDSLFHQQLRRRRMLATLINRFVVQLQTGCGNTECITSTCYTCKARTLPHQARVYTTVAARAMAVELATSGTPEMFICPYITDAQIAHLSVDRQQQTDPKSIVQQLFNTKAFCNFQSTGTLGGAPAPTLLGSESLAEINVSFPHKSASGPGDIQLTCDRMIGARPRHSDMRYNRRMAFLPQKQKYPLLADDSTLTPEVQSILSSLSDFNTLSRSLQDDPLKVWDKSKRHDIPAVRLDHAFRGWDPPAQILIYDSLSSAFASLFRSPCSALLQELSDCAGTALINAIMTAIHALTASIPRTQRDTWHVVWSTIVNGRAYGKQRFRKSDPYTSPWLHILDAFEFEPGHCLLDSLIRAIAARTRAEDVVAMKNTNEGAEAPSSTSATLRTKIIRSLIREEKAVRLAKFGSEQRHEPQHGQSLLGTVSLLWLEWLRKCFLKHWDGSLRLLRYGVAATALELMEDIWKHKDTYELDLPYDLFAIPVVFNNFNIDKVAVDWLNYEHEPDTRHIVSFHNLFTTRAMTLIFRNVNHILMRRAYSSAGAIQKMRVKLMQRPSLRDTAYLDQRLKTAQEPYLVLKINRHSVLSDAYDQTWHRTRDELAKPLRVRMGIDEGEIGHDLGGVQIEFFKLVCAEALNSNYALFTTDPRTHLSWFQIASMVPLYKYQLFGVLFALAVYNGITLPVSFPLVFYCKLLGRWWDSSDICEAWPDQARSLQAICEYDGSVEDDLARDYTFSFTANGLYVEVDMQHPWGDVTADPNTDQEANPGMLKIYHSYPDKHHPDQRNKPVGSTDDPEIGSSESQEASSSAGNSLIDMQALQWPGWRIAMSDSDPPTAVTNSNREDYVKDYARWLIDYSVRPQFRAFAEGFNTVLDPKALSLLSPQILRSLVEGHRTLDINLLQRAATYRGYDSKSQVIKWFWEVVRAYPSDKQNRLLEFVTASSRVPVNGAESLTFVVEKVLVDTGQLPGSSTCFSTLRLPEYESLEKLREKLDIALQHSLGFGQA